MPYVTSSSAGGSVSTPAQRSGQQFLRSRRPTLSREASSRGSLLYTQVRSFCSADGDHISQVHVTEHQAGQLSLHEKELNKKCHLCPVSCRLCSLQDCKIKKRQLGQLFKSAAEYILTTQRY